MSANTRVAADRAEIRIEVPGVVSIMSRPMIIYKRRDGSYYAMMEGRRTTIEKLPDGSFRWVKISINNPEP